MLKSSDIRFRKVRLLSTSHACVSRMLCQGFQAFREKKCVVVFTGISFRARFVISAPEMTSHIHTSCI